jgi:diadenosine tetraphosphate (Ap4A) HIT family hydrolase
VSKPNDLGNIDNSRDDAQRQHMENTVGKGLCPFCDGNGFDANKNKVVRSGSYWRAWFNPFPYTGSKTHIVIATHHHVTDLTELSRDAWAEWGDFNRQFIEDYNLPGGGIVMRFGDNKLNGGTLHHVHSHIQVPDESWFSIAVFYKDPALTAFLADAAERAKQFKASKG